MKKYKIVIHPNSILTQKSVPVKSIGADERHLIEQMIRIMYAEGGVGIAAPQVGASKRIFIASPNAEPGEEIVFINPVITKSIGDQVGPEGCLSLPGVSAEIRRAKKVEFEYMNEKGEKLEGKASDFLARIIQHELDHLDGVLLFDRLDFNQRLELLSGYQRL